MESWILVAAVAAIAALVVWAALAGPPEVPAALLFDLHPRPKPKDQSPQACSKPSGPPPPVNPATLKRPRGKRPRPRYVLGYGGVLCARWEFQAAIAEIAARQGLARRPRRPAAIRANPQLWA